MKPTQEKILFLAPYPFGRVASQRFRFEQYWDLYQEMGIEAHFHSFLSNKEFDILYKKGHHFAKVKAVLFGFLRRFWLLFRTGPYSKIFIHRELTPLGLPFFEFVLTVLLRKKVIYDFDDAIWLSNTSAENRLSALLKCHWKVKYICRWAWKVSCGNPFLRQYALSSNPNSFYVPTTLALENITCKASPLSSPVKLGWTGTHSTLKYLVRLLPVLQELERSLDFQFIVIADKDPRLPLRNYQFVLWKKETEWEDLAQLNIGLMPLENSEWEEGKCGFKALQYMALGIPAIVSPTGANKEVVKHLENGCICQTDEEWKHSILLLLKNEHLRDQFSIKGRATVDQYYSKRVWQHRYQALLLHN